MNGNEMESSASFSENRSSLPRAMKIRSVGLTSMQVADIAQIAMATVLFVIHNNVGTQTVIIMNIRQTFFQRVFDKK